MENLVNCKDHYDCNNNVEVVENGYSEEVSSFFFSRLANFWDFLSFVAVHVMSLERN